jgi:cysteine-rich repeat protein
MRGPFGGLVGLMMTAPILAWAGEPTECLDALGNFKRGWESWARCRAACKGLDRSRYAWAKEADLLCKRPASSVCGNGRREVGEACDDGNLAAWDGCDPTCRLETGTRCGDGVRNGSEFCDDGNQITGDGCDATCKVERVPEPVVCGDGEEVRPEEECDDGNRIAGDGCDGDCRIEPDCGNSRLDFQEGCDDGNATNGDGCSSDCLLEALPPLVEVSRTLSVNEGQWPQSERLLQQAIAHFNSGDTDRARALIDEVLATEDGRTHPYAHHSKARIEHHRGELEAALAALQRARELASGSGNQIILALTDQLRRAILARNGVVEVHPAPGEDRPAGRIFLELEASTWLSEEDEARFRLVQERLRSQDIELPVTFLLPSGAYLANKVAFAVRSGKVALVDIYLQVPATPESQDTPQILGWSGVAIGAGGYLGFWLAASDAYEDARKAPENAAARDRLDLFSGLAVGSAVLGGTMAITGLVWWLLTD